MTESGTDSTSANRIYVALSRSISLGQCQGGGAAKS
jgi:hypothetical protein